MHLVTYLKSYIKREREWIQKYNIFLIYKLFKILYLNFQITNREMSTSEGNSANLCESTAIEMTEMEENPPSYESVASPPENGIESALNSPRRLTIVFGPPPSYEEVVTGRRPTPFILLPAPNRVRTRYPILLFSML